jgi:hypothetical protein
MVAGLIIGLLWFAIFLLAHFAIVWLTRQGASARANRIAALAGLIGVFVSSWVTQAGPTPIALAGATLCGVLLYGGLFVLYMPFYYVVMTSLSVRTAVLLGRQPDGALPLAALEERFASRVLVAQRLQTMAENGFLRATSKGYALTAKGKAIARFFEFFKKLWKLGAGG